MIFASLNYTLLLIALGVGYLVLYLAKREEKQLQIIGYFIGVLIISLAIMYMLGNLIVGFSCQKNLMQFQQGMMKQHMLHRPAAVVKTPPPPPVK